MLLFIFVAFAFFTSSSDARKRDRGGQPLPWWTKFNLTALGSFSINTFDNKLITRFAGQVNPDNLTFAHNADTNEMVFWQPDVVQYVNRSGAWIYNNLALNFGCHKVANWNYARVLASYTALTSLPRSTQRVAQYKGNMESFTGCMYKYGTLIEVVDDVIEVMSIDIIFNYPAYQLCDVNTQNSAEFDRKTYTRDPQIVNKYFKSMQRLPAECDAAEDYCTALFPAGNTCSCTTSL
jgi:hypothetical protein